MSTLKIPGLKSIWAIAGIITVVVQCGGEERLSSADLKKIESAQQSYSARKFEEAKTILVPLREERPKSIEVGVLLARVFFFTRDFKSSEELLRTLSKDNKTSAYVLLWLGKVVASDANRQNEAADIFREILRQDPENFAAHYHLGRCLEAQDKLEQALIEYERASAAEFHISKLHLHMGQLFSHLQMNDRAREHFQRVERLNVYPEDVLTARKAMKGAR